MTPQQRRSVNPRTFRNVFSNWGAFAITAGISFFLAPYIVHHLGNTQYGLWVLLASLVGYMGLLDLGVQSAVTRYVAKYHAVHADQDASRLVSAALAVFTTMGLIAILGALVIALVLVHRLHVPPELVGTAREVLLISGAAMAVSLVGGVFNGLVAGLQRFDLTSGVETVISVLRAAAIVVALGAGGGLVILSLVQLAATAIRGVAAYGLSRRLYPELRPAFTSWGLRDLRLLFSFGLFSSLLQVSNMVLTQADSLIIGAFLPISMVTYFAIALNLTNYASAIVSGVAHTIPPRVGALQAQGAEAETRDVILRTGRVAALLILPVSLTFILRGGTFIRLWMGASYQDLSGAILIPLAVTQGLGAGPHVAINALVGLNRHRRLSLFVLIEAAANLTLSILWIRPLGLVGLALATAVSRLSLGLFVVPWFLARHVGAEARRTYVAFWVRPLLASVPFAIGSYLVERWWIAHSLVVFFLQVGAVLPLMLVGAWLLGLRPAERLMCRRAIAAPVRAALEGV